MTDNAPTDMEVEETHGEGSLTVSTPAHNTRSRGGASTEGTGLRIKLRKTATGYTTGFPDPAQQVEESEGLKVPTQTYINELGFISDLSVFDSVEHAIAYAGGLDSIAGSGKGWEEAILWMRNLDKSKNKEIHAFVCLLAAFTPMELLVTGKRKNVTTESRWHDALLMYLPMHTDESMFSKQGWRSQHVIARAINVQKTWRIAFLCVHLKWAQAKQCESWETKMGQKISEITETNAVVQAMSDATRKIFMRRVMDFRAWGTGLKI